jgi:S-adenosylmethionine synthetase
VYVDTLGTGTVDDARICEAARDFFPLTPGAIIDYLKLRRPLFRKTAAGGHFGRSEPEFTWEDTSRADELAGLFTSTST